MSSIFQTIMHLLPADPTARPSKACFQASYSQASLCTSTGCSPFWCLTGKAADLRCVTHSSSQAGEQQETTGASETRQLGLGAPLFHHHVSFPCSVTTEHLIRNACLSDMHTYTELGHFHYISRNILYISYINGIHKYFQ